jgi:NAD(P)-dependent dehydrogenase (short-subunit alcohol dehydrogenase family)
MRPAVSAVRARPITISDKAGSSGIAAFRWDAAMPDSWAADYRCIRAERAGRLLAAARVVNVTSIHSRLSEFGSLVCDVSKAGLEAATRTAAIELAAVGKLVNAFAPGFVATRMSIVNGINELENAWFKIGYLRDGRLPIGRAAAAAEIADVAGWLIIGSNICTTGQVVTVDGGLSARF